MSAWLCTCGRREREGGRGEREGEGGKGREWEEIQAHLSYSMFPPRLHILCYIIAPYFIYVPLLANIVGET